MKCVSMLCKSISGLLQPKTEDSFSCIPFKSLSQSKQDGFYLPPQFYLWQSYKTQLKCRVLEYVSLAFQRFRLKVRIEKWFLFLQCFAERSFLTVYLFANWELGVDGLLVVKQNDKSLHLHISIFFLQNAESSEWRISKHQGRQHLNVFSVKYHLCKYLVCHYHMTDCC